MQSSIQFKRTTLLFFIPLALACFALVPQTQAVSPTPDGCYPNFTTAEGCNALNFLTTGAGNTGLGWYALFSATTGSFNTGVGGGALALNNGDSNTAVGAAALLLNKVAFDNNAIGASALLNNDSDGTGAANYNNAHGHSALSANVDGTENEAFGDQALEANLASHNTGIGDDALLVNTSGDSNTAVGREAGDTITTGSHNVAIGDFAGAGTITASHNIAIGVGATGPFADISDTCWIGSISGQPTSDPTSTTQVYVDANNVVGGIISSRRYKHDIKPMDKASEALFALKPVSFKYNYDKKNTRQYGLIAEDVADVDPTLAAVDKDGKPYSVRYDLVNVLLLNEFLKEHKAFLDEHRTVEKLKKEVAALTAGLQKVSAQLEASKPAPQVVNNP